MVFWSAGGAPAYSSEKRTLYLIEILTIIIFNLGLTINRVIVADCWFNYVMYKDVQYVGSETTC